MCEFIAQLSGSVTIQFRVAFVMRYAHVTNTVMQEKPLQKMSKSDLIDAEQFGAVREIIQRKIGTQIKIIVVKRI